MKEELKWYFLNDPKSIHIDKKKEIELEIDINMLFDKYQLERLNPEDAKSVCDSPNSENK